MKIAFALCALLVAGGLTLKAADDKPKLDPEAVFKKLDANSDGSVSKEEYMASPQSKKDTAKAGERFGKIDKDSDGKLTLDEYKAGMTGKKKKAA